MDLCRFLRWKGFHGQRWPSQAALDATLTRIDVPCSCLKTCQSWGPDDELVAPESCARGRGCFERSPLTPQERVLS
ncbi:MAG: hypothetical protein H6739_14160 [Alphaproteobacteria bacterium]|nr:hypothetical protein [Alphaproteobacteria bacterium]